MNHSDELRQTEVKMWFADRHYGFAHNPDLDDVRDIFIHSAIVAGGVPLITGQRIRIKFTTDRTHRLKVTQLEIV